MATFGGGTPTFGGNPNFGKPPGSGVPPNFGSAEALARLPQCATPAFGIFASLAEGDCAMKLACVCEKTGFVFLAAIEGAISKICTVPDQKVALAFLRQTCGDLVPSLNKSRSDELVSSFAIVLGLAWIAVALRFVARRVAASKLGMDDLFTLLALIFNSVLSLSELYAVRFGAGKHMIMISPSQLKDFGKLSFTSQLAFAISITFAKLSLLYLYHRIFKMHRFTTTGIIIGVIVVLWCIATLAVTIFNCYPVRFFWDKSIPGGHCLNGKVQTWCLAATSIFTDIFIWIVPIPWLWGLRMNWPKKVGLMATFAIGGFVCIAGVVRVVFIEKLVFNDITWSSVDLEMWVNVECGIGIVCTCLPILRPLFRVILPRSVLARFSNDPVDDGPYKLTNQPNIRGKLRRIPSNLAGYNEPESQEDTLGSGWRHETGSTPEGFRAKSQDDTLGSGGSHETGNIRRGFKAITAMK